MNKSNVTTQSVWDFAGGAARKEETEDVSRSRLRARERSNAGRITENI